MGNRKALTVCNEEKKIHIKVGSEILGNLCKERFNSNPLTNCKAISFSDRLHKHFELDDAGGIEKSYIFAVTPH